MIKPVAAVLCLMCLAFITHAQTFPAADSASVASTSAYAVGYFNKNISQQSQLYSGPEYISLPKATKGSPLWKDNDKFTLSAVKYNGVWYNGVPLLYDVYKGQVISMQPVNNYRFIMHSYLLSDFILDNRHFIYVHEPDSVKQSLKTGYYELLYSGKTTVLCRHTKDRTEAALTHGVEVYFDDETSYYIVKGNNVYGVSGKGSVLNAFKDKKKELSSYVNKNDINFDNKAIAITKLAEYYDQISQ